MQIFKPLKVYNIDLVLNPYRIFESLLESACEETFIDFTIVIIVTPQVFF